MSSGNCDEAILSSKGQYVLFSYGGRTIKFRGPYSLERFDSILTWDRGYIEVMTKYAHSPNCIEEYIDLVPVLENLYMNANEFISPIKKVRIEYA